MGSDASREWRHGDDLNAEFAAENARVNDGQAAKHVLAAQHASSLQKKNDCTLHY